MASFNKVILIGNLTRDSDLRFLPNGAAVCKFTMAINRKYSTEGGEKKEEVTFVDIKAWGKQAEVIAQYCKKGKPLMVEGRLNVETWDDKTTGKKMSRMLVVLESFQFIGEKSNGAAEPQRQASPATKQREPLGPDGPLATTAKQPEEDDVPF